MARGETLKIAEPILRDGDIEPYHISQVALFEIFSKEKQEQCASGNYFDETDLLITRLDQLSKNADYQEKLKEPIS